ncbi:MAG: site-2 protease family protein [Pseudomonadota bacterium]
MSSSQLPALRQDLQLFEGPEALNGAKTWAVYDPVRNRHFKIGEAAFALLSRWHEGTVEAILTAAKRLTGGTYSANDIEEVLKFLTANSLIETKQPQEIANLLAQYRAATNRDLGWFARNLFFFRIPILRAERLLKMLAGICEPLYSRGFRIMLALMAVLGVYLVIRQLDAFVTSFEYFFTWQGVMLFVLSLILLKVIHEFAHGVTATRYGARVSNMGVAFMVFFPVLYTDVSDSWRIQSRKQRLLVGAAGVLVELYVAIICTFLWSFLPDGTYRSAVFFLATTSWIWTLAINVNPFMKFDGYYLLSDYWEVENLQNRAFALGKWRLRELLFDIQHDIPDALPAKRVKQLIIYGWLTWIYRALLFFSIAFLILNKFFKLAAVLLLLASAYKFIGKPIMDELNAWNSMRGEIFKRGRTCVSLLGLVAFAVVLFFPWYGTVTAPGIIMPEQRTVIYPEKPALLAEILVNDRQTVKAGDVLYRLKDPALDEEIKITQRRLNLIDLKLSRRAASKEDRANLLILNQELAEYQSKLDGLLTLADKLEIVAPFDGEIVNTHAELQEGRWLPTDFEMSQLIQPKSLFVEAVLTESSLALVQAGDPATFNPDELELDELAAEVVAIERANLRALHIPYLQSSFGGAVAVREDEMGNRVPENSVFRITLKLLDYPDDNAKVIRGVAAIDGTTISLAKRIYRRIASVLIRESGF